MSHFIASWRSLRICAFVLAATAAGPALAVPILTTGIFNSPGTASSGTVGTPDQMFGAAGGSNIESFGFEGIAGLTNQQIRINALTAPSTFTNSVAANSSFAWVSGRQYNFTESYSGDATKNVAVVVTDSVTLNTYSLNYTANYGNVKSLIFRERTRAGNTTTTSSSVTFSNLSLGGTSFGNVITLNNNATSDIANYFQINNFDFTGAWTLSGAVAIAWTGATSGSTLGFQIKAWQSEVAAVPEPASIALLAMSVAGLAGISRRRAG